MPVTDARVSVTPPRAEAGRPGLWPLAAFGLFLLAMVVVGRTVELTRHLETAQAWTGALGILAPVAYVAVYMAATLIGVPGLPFTLLAPALFGALPAFVVMVVASTLSAVLAFLIARYAARATFAVRLADTEGWRRLSNLVERHDWVVIPLVRIVPVAPFAVLNYGFGLTGISFWRYLLWSELAMIPMNAVLVLGADLFYSVTTRGIVSWPSLAVAGMAAAVLATLAVIGRKALARE